MALDEISNIKYNSNSRNLARAHSNIINFRYNDDIGKRLARLAINRALKGTDGRRMKIGAGSFRLLEDKVDLRLEKSQPEYTQALHKEVDYLDVSKLSYVNGNPLDVRDREKLHALTEMFVPYVYDGNVYFVSSNLMEEYRGELSGKIGDKEKLASALEELTRHPDINVVNKEEKLEFTNASVHVVYKTHTEEKYPEKDREHTSLLMANTCESAGEGYGSRVPDELVKGGEKYLDHLPTPGQTLFEMHGRSKGIRGFHIDDPVADELAKEETKSQKKQNL